jgi:hypothetical protein
MSMCWNVGSVLGVHYQFGTYCLWRWDDGFEPERYMPRYLPKSVGAAAVGGEGR